LITEPAPRFEQVASEHVAHVDGRAEVQPDQLVPAGQAQVAKAHHEVRPARVVHHDVDVTELIDGDVRGGGHIGLVGHVGGDHDGLPAGGEHVVSGVREPFGRAHHQGHVRASYPIRQAPAQGERCPAVVVAWDAR
jgi:hypothetical protein